VLIDHWPLFGLRITTPRLELRLPTEDELADLATLAMAGVHDPAVMPFHVAWTDLPPEERARSVIQHSWRVRAEWQPEAWALDLGVFYDGRVVGYQSAKAKHLATLREVDTASWLGLAYQGNGIGTEMRAAVLDLAFTGLGAECAVSGAFTDNPASYRVSEKLGYQDSGVERMLVRGEAVSCRQLRLTRERWAANRSVPVTVTGLEPCLPLFGIAGFSQN
jgi:RimJ/RimL family protein N-acetyltransferase